MEPKIAAVLGIYNEVNRIETTLRSLKYFDEVLVTDKGSDDGTIEIVKKYTDKIYTVPLSEDKTNPGYVKVWNQLIEDCTCEWIVLLTASDIVHPEFVERAKEYIAYNDQVDVIEVPIYRYSMGFCGARSFYGGLQYKDLLLKKKEFLLDKDTHKMVKYREGLNIGTMNTCIPTVAIYHLTHESLDMIIERHLRYAEAEVVNYDTRKYGLKRTWKDIFRQIYLYIKLGTYKLGDKGKAQLCMLLLYRSAKFLNIYFDEATNDEIKKKYDEIRNNGYDSDIN